MSFGDNIVAVETVSTKRKGRDCELVVGFNHRLLKTGGGHVVVRGDSTYDRADEYSDLLLSILHELFDHSVDVQYVKIMGNGVSAAMLFIHYTEPENTTEMLGRIHKAIHDCMMLVDQ